jgi:hypothetical protein
LRGDIDVAWRRAAGASIMFVGAGFIVVAAAMATLMAAADVQAGSDAWAIAFAILGGWMWPLAGIVTMLMGRAVYGHWYEAAPIANITGLVTRTVGLVAASVLGAMLVLLVVSGVEREDMPAAAALGIGVTMALLLAHIGVGLRASGQRYPDYSASSAPPE